MAVIQKNGLGQYRVTAYPGSKEFLECQYSYDRFTDSYEILSINVVSATFATLFETEDAAMAAQEYYEDSIDWVDLE